MRPPLIAVSLVHIHGPMKGEIQEFSQGVIRIGRHPSNDVRFPSDLTTISRYHAEIIREGNRFHLVDKSANGVFVNGKKLPEVFLRDGDVIEFADGGPKVSFLTQMREDGGEDREFSVADTPHKEPPSRQLEPVLSRPVVPLPRATIFDDMESKPAPRPATESPPDEEVYRVSPRSQNPNTLDAQIVAAPLVIQYGPTVRSYKQLPIIIGRHPKCDFVLDRQGILDQHVQIFFVQGQYWLKDLTGQQLLRVNQAPVGSPVPLAVNDALSLTPKGPFFRFVGEGRFAEDSQSETANGESAAEAGPTSSTADTSTDKPKGGLLSKVKKRLF